MDVKCERCSTEYEFDDALVSGRGTTVKCTNCGHKFKIRRDDGDFSEDYWNVTTGDGRTLVFTSLRELQRAIQGSLVERGDRMSRGGLPPKPIGQIPELLPFFEECEASKAGRASARASLKKTHGGLGPAPTPPPERPRQAPPAETGSSAGKTTLIGTGPLTPEEAFPATAAPLASAPPPPTERDPDTAFAPSSGARAPAEEGAPALVGIGPAETAEEASASAPPRPAAGAPPSAPPEPHRRAAAAAPPARSTLPPVPPARSTLPPVPPARSTPPSAPPARSALPSAPPVRSTPPSAPPARSTPPSAPPAGSALPRASVPPPLPARARPSGAPASPSEAAPAVDAAPSERRAPRSLLAEIDGERGRLRGPAASDPDPLLPRRRSVGGFVVAAVVMGGVLMLAAVWAQKNLGVALGTRPPPSAPAADPRVSTFLSTGEKALADGNLDLAKESLDKASALAEREPRVLLALARLAAVRADVLWLKVRLLPEDAADDLRVTRDGLADLAASARKAADGALAVAPDDPAALRAKIDALRIAGEREGARALVGKIAASSGQPESAYVLAALDLAEAEPLWPTILDRLRTAASAEAGPGRARATLVYALARSGDAAGALSELDRLNALTKPHALLPLLRRFAEAAKANAKPEGAADAGRGKAAGAGGDVADVKAEPSPTSSAAKAGAAAPAAGAMPSDPRELVKQGERARTRGDYARARALYSAAVEKNPNDSEALAGLAQIAYAERDLPAARAAFKRVLAVNPNYMPALVGLADVEWESGDKATATRMYKDIVDRYPEGAYPARVKQRTEGGG